MVFDESADGRLNAREQRENEILMTTNHTSIQLHPVAVLNRLVALLSSVAPGLKPRLQKATFRAIYSTLGIGMKNEDSAFLNYGYSPLNSSGGGLKLEPADEMDRFSIQLYSRVAGARDLRGKEVVEIGCGRFTLCHTAVLTS